MSVSIQRHQGASPAPPANPRQARILEAARRCFASKGFRETTIIDVAEAAGVSRPLVYKYFGDKDGLIDAVLETTFEEWSALNSSLMPVGGGDTDDPAAALASKFSATIAFVRERPVFGAILNHDSQVVVRGHLDGLRQSRAVSLAATREIVVAGIEAGTFREDLAVDSVAASLEMVLFSLLQRALGLLPELVLEDELVSTTLDLLIRGLRPDPARD